MPPPNDHRDGPRDECGVFGIYAPDHDVARLAYFALFALQHRGQESAGIATAPRGGGIMAIREQGLVAQVFNEHMLRSLVGEMAIGHVRYSTTGSSEWENAQPIVRDDRRTLALAHNGNLINAVQLHSELRGREVPFSSTSDSEIIAALLATHPAERIEDAVADVVPQLKGAFSTVVMTEDAVVAFRDPAGVRPLALGELVDEDGRPSYCVASESCAFDLIGARLRQCGGAWGGAGGGPAPGRRIHQEPLRRAHIHPARPGAPPPRRAAEVQSAARGGQR